MPLSPVSVRFPIVVAALRAAEKILWKIGDALIEECGPPGKHGATSGVLDKLDQCALELQELGFETSREYLRELRRTAASFPDGDRSPSVPFTVHSEAGGPAILKKAMEAAARDNVRPTVAYVKDFKIRQRQGEEQAEDPQSAKTRAMRALDRELANVIDLNVPETEVIEIIHSRYNLAQRWPDFKAVFEEYFREEDR